MLTFQTHLGMGDDRAQRPQTQPGTGQKVMLTEPGLEGGEGIFQAEGTLGAGGGARLSGQMWQRVSEVGQSLLPRGEG